MIEFVNAKINIGLQIVGRRSDGYHNLQTLFYPVGKYAGSPDNKQQFCDILEITRNSEEDDRFFFNCRYLKCSLENNLIYKAVKLLKSHYNISENFDVFLDKFLPDGAGLGGGSADAAFTLKTLDKLIDLNLSKEELCGLALKLGADCPFFIYNKPLIATGIGDVFCETTLNLSSKWVVIVKPNVFISTKEAFSGIRINKNPVDLRNIAEIPMEDWQDLVVNDFEQSIFPLYKDLRHFKERLLSDGAIYASMSGSGSSIYGIFDDFESAEYSKKRFEKEPTLQRIYLLKL